jgi:hypothetical protein
MSGGVERREGAEARDISISALDVRTTTCTLHGRLRQVLTETSRKTNDPTRNELIHAAVLPPCILPPFSHRRTQCGRRHTTTSHASWLSACISIYNTIRQHMHQGLKRNMVLSNLDPSLSFPCIASKLHSPLSIACHPHVEFFSLSLFLDATYLGFFVSVGNTPWI